MKFFFEWMRMLYVYCTDFIINLANLTGLAYYEINFIIFCVLYPLLTIGLLVLYGVQRWRLKQLLRKEGTGRNWILYMCWKSGKN